MTQWQEEDLKAWTLQQMRVHLFAAGIDPPTLAHLPPVCVGDVATIDLFGDGTPPLLFEVSGAVRKDGHWRILGTEIGPSFGRPVNVPAYRCKPVSQEEAQAYRQSRDAGYPARGAKAEM